MAELAVTGPGVPLELEFGLDLILDGLERRLASTRRPKKGKRKR
jgi:hypothetical protein